MKIRNHFRSFIFLGLLFLSLGAFSQGNGSNPIVKKFGQKFFLTVGSDKSKSFIPSADGVLVEFKGRNYMVEGIQKPFTISAEEEESSDEVSQTNPKPEVQNQGSERTPKPNLAGERGQTISHDAENSGKNNCGVESDSAKLLDYVEELAIKERKNLGIADKPDELLPTNIKGKINDKKMVIEDYLRFKYHLAAGHPLSDFSSILGKPIGAPSKKPKIDLKELFKNGTEVTQEGIRVNLAQALEEDVNLKVQANQISSDEFFTPDCNFTETLNAGEKSTQYTFADKCTEFDTAQGGRINYRLYLNNESVYFKNSSIVVTGN